MILDDADLEKAVTYGVRDCFTNSGQTCNALTRMLVPRAWSAEAATIAAQVADGLVVGDPLDASTELGPLVSEVQRDRVRSFVRRGLDEGSRMVAGGTDSPVAGDGYFVRPTVFADVSNDMTIAREEIFGPVLVVIAYDDEADAVRIANDSDYGLWAAVWSSERGARCQVARRLRGRWRQRQRSVGDEPDAVRGLQAVRTGSRDGSARPDGVPRGQGARGLTASP